jgi:RNA recognition motif-containing protein
MGSDRITGRSRGFAFVTFSAEEESKLAAAQLNGSDVGGRRLSVSEARPREESTGARYGTADRQAPNDSRS